MTDNKDLVEIYAKFITQDTEKFSFTGVPQISALSLIRNLVESQIYNSEETVTRIRAILKAMDQVDQEAKR